MGGAWSRGGVAGGRGRGRIKAAAAAAGAGSHGRGHERAEGLVRGAGRAAPRRDPGETRPSGPSPATHTSTHPLRRGGRPFPSPGGAGAGGVGSWDEPSVERGCGHPLSLAHGEVWGESVGDLRPLFVPGVRGRPLPPWTAPAKVPMDHRDLHRGGPRELG